MECIFVMFPVVVAFLVYVDQLIANNVLSYAIQLILRNPKSGSLFC